MIRTRNPPSATAVTGAARQAARRAKGTRTIELPAEVITALDEVVFWECDRSRVACVTRLVAAALASIRAAHVRQDARLCLVSTPSQ